MINRHGDEGLATPGNPEPLKSNSNYNEKFITLLLLACTQHDDNTDTILTLPLFSETQNPLTFSLDSKLVEMDNFWEDH